MATVDGAAAAMFATDVALRGVYVPWDTHIIEWVYQPKRVYAGGLISLLSLIACGLGLAFARRERRTLEPRL